ncbi:hypothetical protein RUM43_006558 [Polyplax serrata]|uniref:SANT domain-containing protein n=1 Tax=Polyplax serrata TaxID=468196 RepID=A0AAN8PBM9_POLSC
MNGDLEMEDEPLGSVTQLECSSPGATGVPVRSSARVSKKLRLDSLSKPISGLSVSDKKDGVKDESDLTGKKCDTKCKKIKSHNWSAQGKDIFFEALNEYGKDFEAIQRYFAVKTKKKSGSEVVMKTKEQIRHFYYRTWTKISKHLKFPSEIKKQTQELYGLINYGEFRKKMGCVTEKTSLKLNELVITGFTHLRLKGKNVHIRTPRCRALRRLNQLEECQEDIKLPSRILVELVPRCNDSWARVQSTAQNPCVQISVPLQYRLVNLIQYFQKRWLPRHKNKMLKTYQVNGKEDEGDLLVVGPKPNAQVHISEVNLSQYLTSSRICLSSHEERLGRKGSCDEILKNLKAESRGKGKKHLKSEEKELKKSIEKASPDPKRTDGEESAKPMEMDGKGTFPVKNVTVPEEKETKSGDVDVQSPELSSDEKPNFGFVSATSAAGIDLEDLGEMPQADILDDTRPCDNNNTKSEKIPDFIEGLMKLQNKDEAIAKIRNGWSLENSHSLALGDLYLMIGSEYKLQLDYWWKSKKEPFESTVENNLDKLSTMLSKLIRLTRLTRARTKLSCLCGHQCSEDMKASARGRRPVNDSTMEVQKTTGDVNRENAVVMNSHQGALNSNDTFRKPSVHAATKSRLDPEAFKAQLDKLTPRYCNRRGRGIAAKNVVVQRTLPLLPKANNGHAIVTLKLIPQTSQFSGEFMPVSLVTSGPNSPRDAGDITRRRIEQPIAPKPSPTSERASTPVEHSLSPTPSVSALLEDHDPMMAVGNADNNFTGLSGNYECSSLPPPSPSPTVILREEDWLNGEIADYSLSSILGHLETPVKNTNCQSYDTTSEVENQLQCLMTETSIDYMAKFADLAAKLSSENSP